MPKRLRLVLTTNLTVSYGARESNDRIEWRMGRGGEDLLAAGSRLVMRLWFNCFGCLLTPLTQPEPRTWIAMHGITTGTAPLHCALAAEVQKSSTPVHW